MTDLVALHAAKAHRVVIFTNWNHPMTDPASIRFNNPGAMWGERNKIATKWGATNTVGLNDGLGQGNNIAVFPTKIAGACAEFDLWRSNYCNLTLQGAISKWSGGNSSAAYMENLTLKSGVSAGEIITPTLLASPRGLALIKAQAQWEAGTVYPLSDAEWQQAQVAVFNGVRTGPIIASGGVAGGTVAAAHHAHASGYHWGVVIGILAVGLVIAAVVYLMLRKNKSDGPQALPIQTPPLPGPARPRIPDVPGGGARV